jgi:hypothetical protein
MKYSSNKELNELLRKAEPFCSRIERGKHIKAYPLNSNVVIVISSTGSDRMFIKAVKRDFKHNGILLD